MSLAQFLAKQVTYLAPKVFSLKATSYLYPTKELKTKGGKKTFLYTIKICQIKKISDPFMLYI